MATPVKQTRDLEKSRNEILQAAFIEIFARGFQGVSVDDIVKRTNLTKGAFYHQFPTKLALGYALVEEVIQPMIFHRWITPLQAFEDPLDGILHLIETLIGGAEPKELRLGCPLNNLVQEMAPIDREFKKRLQTALSHWISEIERELRRGQRAGFILSDVDVKQVAYFVVMAHEGFYGMLKALPERRAFESLLNSLQRFFVTIRPAR